MAEPSAAGRTFDQEALPHLDALYRVALRLTGDASQAEDLVQDTMLKAYRSWRQYRPGTNAKGMVDSNYFTGGYAIHGYASVPPFAASHGCVRTPIANAAAIFGWLRIGDAVIVER